jgi:hypothetical protein
VDITIRGMSARRCTAPPASSLRDCRPTSRDRSPTAGGPASLPGGATSTPFLPLIITPLRSARRSSR